jgi:hypothetical protein
MGRRLFDIVDGPKGWNDEMATAPHAAQPRSSSAHSARTFASTSTSPS